MSDLRGIDDEREERRTGRGRRSDDSDRSDRPASPWTNPSVWIAIISFLWVVSTTVLGIIWTKLDAIGESVQASRDMMIQVTTRQTAEIAAMEDRIRKLESQAGVQQQAYNFNFSTRLAVVEAKTGVKSKQED